jgi:hypothetical protein
LPPVSAIIEINVFGDFMIPGVPCPDDTYPCDRLARSRIFMQLSFLTLYGALSTYVSEYMTWRSGVTL